MSEESLLPLSMSRWTWLKTHGLQAWEAVELCNTDAIARTCGSPVRHPLHLCSHHKMGHLWLQLCRERASLRRCPLGWELQKAPLREPRDTSILNGSHCRICPVRDGRSRDTEPWATDPLCVDPSGQVLKDAVSLLRHVTPQLLLAEVWLSLALGLRDSPAVATALGACPAVLWPRLRSRPWAATPAGFTHTVAPMAALCRRRTSSATSPAHHGAGKTRLEGPFGWKIRGVEPGGGCWTVQSFPPPLRTGPVWGKTAHLLPIR